MKDEIERRNGGGNKKKHSTQENEEIEKRDSKIKTAKRIRRRKNNPKKLPE